VTRGAYIQSLPPAERRLARRRLAQRQPTARDRIWQAMRILRTFTVPALCATAGAGPANVRDYVQALIAAGYLRPAGKQDRRRVYRLTRNTGPYAPRLCARDTEILDLNILETSHAR
jgi:hypothetical protein